MSRLIPDPREDKRDTSTGIARRSSVTPSRGYSNEFSGPFEPQVNEVRPNVYQYTELHALACVGSSLASADNDHGRCMVLPSILNLRSLICTTLAGGDLPS